jgi:hypothetical protein
MPGMLPIPQKLTKADWDKNKGAIAKLAGETGMGAQMEKVKKAWDAVDINVLDGGMACPPSLIKNTTQVEPKLKASKDQFDGAGVKNPNGSVAKLRAEVNALRDLATTTAEKFKKNPLIPKSSTEYAAAIAKEADLYSVALMINGVFATACFKSFEEVKQKLEKNAAEGRKQFKTFIDNFAKFGKEVLENPTVENYIGEAQKGFHQSVRGLGAALMCQSEKKFIDFNNKWRPFTLDTFRPKKNDEVKKKVEEVLKLVEEFKKIAT